MKVKDKTEKDKEKQFEENLAYEEFLMANNTESNSYNLGETNSVFCKAKILKPPNFPFPLNNLHYQPLQGA